jgi:hypothetical protein
MPFHARVSEFFVEALARECLGHGVDEGARLGRHQWLRGRPRDSVGSIHFKVSSIALASLRSGVAKPSVNQA